LILDRIKNRKLDQKKERKRLRRRKDVCVGGNSRRPYSEIRGSI
jgi:hypothetical protein